jgi:hypothetical protein
MKRSALREEVTGGPIKRRPLMFAALSPYVAGLVILWWLAGAYVIPRDFIRVQRSKRAAESEKFLHG